MSNKTNYGGFSKPVDLTNLAPEDYPELKADFKYNPKKPQTPEPKQEAPAKAKKLEKKFEEVTEKLPEVDMTNTDIRKTYKVAVKALNIRHRPNVKSRIRGVLKEGSLVKGVPVNSDWMQIYSDIKSKLYLKLEHLVEV